MNRNWDYPLREGMAHETIFAVRTPVGWRMFAWECQPDDVDAKLIDEGMGGLEWRLLTHHHIRQGLHSHFTNTYSLRNGWHREPGTENWFPMEEPLPRIPGSPIKSSVAISLEMICHGIHWSVEAGGHKIRSFLDELDDSLTLWVRFVQILESGGAPHAALCSSGPTHVVIQAEAEAGMCRLYVLDHQGEQTEKIDVVVERKKLIQAFRGFLAEIADHPCLAHSYLCCGDFPDELYEPACDAADADWESAVKEGRFSPDDWDAERDFVERRIAARLPLTEKLAPIVERYQAMLRTLAIPDGWAE